MTLPVCKVRVAVDTAQKLLDLKTQTVCENMNLYIMSYEWLHYRHTLIISEL